METEALSLRFLEALAKELKFEIPRTEQDWPGILPAREQASVLRWLPIAQGFRLESESRVIEVELAKLPASVVHQWIFVVSQIVLKWMVLLMLEKVLWLQLKLRSPLLPLAAFERLGSKGPPRFLA